MKRRRAPKDYPPGFFTTPVRAWFGKDWQPMWPRFVKRDTNGHSIADRERQVQAGIAWGSGTITMPGTPVNQRPGWMK